MIVDHLMEDNCRGALPPVLLHKSADGSPRIDSPGCREIIFVCSLEMNGIAAISNFEPVLKLFAVVHGYSGGKVDRIAHKQYFQYPKAQ
jgi:hypothetical protein